ncbi:MAG: TlyA family RNA methyltransferase [Phycisphaerae bacterium]|nr:TlyA family RNA methyltransferase [Phycisphaerae bacterium]
MGREEKRQYVSRGGLKLDAALAAFGVDVGGLICADLGSNVGGFVDCLLSHDATKVYSVDTGYGVLDYGLRKEGRVVVMERTNAMHVVLPEPIDLVTIDVGWTRQRNILPPSARLLKDGGRILSLLKPHYEAPPKWLRKGVLPAEKVPVVVETVVASLAKLGVSLLGQTDSPITGQAGNHEVWLYLRRS